jgi:glycolate oxidase FAD binding subunit
LSATATSPAEVAERLAGCAAAGRAVRIAGGGTRSGWGSPVEAEELSTRGLDEIAEHSHGDFTAVLGAGIPIERAQAAFAEAGQMLAVDPPSAPGATLGGLVATGDSGPLRHRYGGPRDLVIGVTVALPDGTVAQAGGKVIKNVAGYDLSKLMAGSFGTLGVIVGLAVRLHPRPEKTATARFASDEPDELRRIADELAHRPLELDALDVAYTGGEGAILARFGGTSAPERAAALSGAEVVEDDEELWARQRAGQRSADGTVVRVAALPSELPDVLRAADATGAHVVGRAGVGLSYLSLPADAKDAVERLRSDLAPAACVVLDAPAALRAALDPWGVAEGAELELARRVKARFDPDRVCNPGLFIGGI